MVRAIRTEEAPAKPSDFSQATTTGELVFTAGQVPMTADGEVRREDTLAAQTRLCLENLSAVLAAAGADRDDVLKTTVYLTDMDGFDEMNRVYRDFFDRDMPARSVVDVDDVLKGAAVEIEAVAERDR